MAVTAAAGTAWEVVVDRSGQVVGLGPRRTVPAGLLRYAAAFLATRHESARFLWAQPRDAWLAVCLERRAGAAGSAGSEATALLSLADTELPRSLTSREIDVLTLLALGLTNAQISGRLGTSARTVSTQVERLLSKLGQTGRGGLAAVAVDNGLLRLPIPGGAEGVSGLTLADIEQRAGGTPVTERWRATAPAYPRRRPFLLGSVIPMTGPVASDGLEMLRGAGLAVQQINRRGGIGGRPIEHVVVGADFFEPDSVTAAFESVFDHDVDALISSYPSAENPAALDLAADFARPYLHTATFEEQVQLVREDPTRYGTVFQTCPSELHYGTGFVRLLDELAGSGRWQPPSRRLLLVEADAVSTHTANELFFDRAERSGWEVSEVIRVPLFPDDWTSVLARLHDIGPAAVMVTHFVADALAGFQHAFSRDATDALVYCVYGPSVPAFSESLGDIAEGVIWSTVTGVYDDSLGKRFREEYRREYAAESGWSQAGAAYDQVGLLASAWTATGGSDPRDVTAALRHLVHRGVNGVYYLGTAGQCALAYPDVTSDPSIGQAHLVYQIQGGQHRVLGPAPFGTVSAFREPPWRTAQGG
ncbi:ABC transporter substrate-binding protein [Peterkaempfera bronchialis]|uniref:HTH luxR-type domain-containing protein n=1 Tax=Peterkaempfera bronchialis TaxID=2126346 RepID=A0A345T3N2_9ACTN|nr:ABC transporter substrate-binding protein [Peterkaempfera bronchialis]AXI80587.1 hypothetical protein C7M71_027555 [Peterkaempfera bronchialis]